LKSIPKSLNKNIISIVSQDIMRNVLQDIEQSHGIKCVEYKWLLDCVSQFKILNKEDYYL
jgi:hypothetical protein